MTYKVSQRKWYNHSRGLIDEGHTFQETDRHPLLRTMQIPALARLAMALGAAKLQSY
jgi:hypothetical protein